MTRLPLTVVGGYLGAGKTTLINRLLAAKHGVRLMVMVNDFGAINVDAALLQSEKDDTIELTNGCVCCTMGADLFRAIAKVLDRPARPDHIVVEASGIADPSKIANFAVAEPELSYAGILTVVDGAGFDALMADERIAPQVARQVQVADLVAVSKTPATDPEVVARLLDLEVDRVIGANDSDLIVRLLLDDPAPAQPRSLPAPSHPAYVQWNSLAAAPMSRQEIAARLSQLPEGVMRLKGFVPDRAGGTWEIQVVGRKTDLSHRDDAMPTALVAIGLRERMLAGDVEAWWTTP